MASPSRSFFGTVKDKLSRKGSNRSTKSNMSSHSARGDDSATNPFSDRAVSALAPAPIPDSRAPPPSYSEATGGSNPTITVQAPANRRAASPSPSGASHISVASLSTPEDPFAFLSSFDTILLIDDSGSMAGRSWREVKEVLRSIVPICTAHDADGIDVYFLNGKNRRDPASTGWRNVRDNDTVEMIFNEVRPQGGTPTGQRINFIMKPYLRAYEQAIARNGGDPDNTGVKPTNMIVITDGVPTDDPEGVIISIAKKLDKLEAPPYQVGIQFFQVGNENGAARALQELDDSLAEMGGGIRDIVDTVTWSARDGTAPVLTSNAILKVVLGAVVRRLDRRRASGESARPSRDRLRP